MAAGSSCPHRCHPEQGRTRAIARATKRSAVGISVGRRGRKIENQARFRCCVTPYGSATERPGAQHERRRVLHCVSLRMTQGKANPTTPLVGEVACPLPQKANTGMNGRGRARAPTGRVRKARCQWATQGLSSAVILSVSRTQA